MFQKMIIATQLRNRVLGETKMNIPLFTEPSESQTKNLSWGRISKRLSFEMAPLFWCFVKGFSPYIATEASAGNMVALGFLHCCHFCNIIRCALHKGRTLGFFALFPSIIGPMDRLIQDTKSSVQWCPICFGAPDWVYPGRADHEGGWYVGHLLFSPPLHSSGARAQRLVNIGSTLGDH